MTPRSTDLGVIYRPIQSQLQAAETLLVKELAAQEAFRNSLMGELTRHVARMSGKRIRPALALFGAGVAASLSSSSVTSSSRATSSPRKRGSGSRFRGNDRTVRSQAIRLAVAVEMIHTATLLHDDVIDGASLRRGLATLNAKWGDTLSILSGDYLYSKAFCLLSELDHPKVQRLMSDTARIVCEGEVSQIQHQYDLTLSREKYLTIIHWKTASLMGASAEAGALLGGASPAQAARLGIFGVSFGLAFQILDDTQDLVGDQDLQGKSLGTDLALGQMTLPLLYLRDSAGPELRRRLAQCFTGNGSRSAAQVQEQYRFLKEQAMKHQVPAYCKRIANRHLAKACAALAPFPPSAHKSSLLALADFLLS